MKMDSKEQRSAELEREIELTRLRIEERGRELQARLSVREIVNQLIDQARSSKGRDYFANLGRAVTENPLPTTLTGVALGWLAYASNHPSGTGGNGSGNGQESLASRAAHSGRMVSQQLRAGSRRIQSTWNHYLEEQPLVLGLLGLTIGAALGASLPSTDTEDEIVGPASDALKKKAADKGLEQVEALGKDSPPAENDR